MANKEIKIGNYVILSPLRAGCIQNHYRNFSSVILLLKNLLSKAASQFIDEGITQIIAGHSHINFIWLLRLRHTTCTQSIYAQSYKNCHSLLSNFHKSPYVFY